MTSSVQSLTTILKKSDITDHEEVLKAANNQLKTSKNDIDALHAKAVSLLKLDRYEDALRTFETGDTKLKNKAKLEYAYALYKTGKAKEAAEVVSQEDSRGAKHLEAQASYRTEDFARAAELYKQLSKQLQTDAEADLKINAGAVDAQLEWSGRGHLSRREKPDLYAFETAYNSACQSIARGELAQGEVLLRRARDVCASAEELSEEDKAAELLPISVQQVYVLARLGKQDEAEKLAKTIDAKAIPDLGSRHIAQVNGVAASSEAKSAFMAQRLAAKDLASLKPDYPFAFQANILNQDRYASALQAQKFDGTAASTAASISKAGAPSVDAAINALAAINAAAHAKNETGKAALKHIVPLLEKRPNDVGLILTICQLYVLTSNTAAATSLLDAFFKRLEQSGNSADQDVRFAPGLVAAATSLYSSQGRRENTRHELAKAATFWRRRGKGEDQPPGVTHLLKAAGSALLDSQDPADLKVAKEIFTHLHESDSGDKYAAAGLLAASLQPSADATKEANLTSLDRLLKDIDTDALESGGVALPPSGRQASVHALKRSAPPATPPKPKKPRKSRLPKDYDPEKKPDPERWLPMKDRSSYKPKGKKGKARQALLSQGSAPADSDGSRPATPAGQVVQGKAGGGGAGKKKKGKGNKW